jgi:phage gpG-like protein
VPTRREGGEAIVVSDLAPLMKALRRIEGTAARDLRRELREIANDVKMTAQAGVRHTTGRHGGPNLPRLRDSIKASTTNAGASIYSESPYASVQDVGGQVGKGAIIRRASASHYMTGAVREAQPYISRRMEGLLDEFGREFERG